MNPPTPYILIPDLIIGHVYRLRCRNLTFGAYDGKQFVGIREKFDRLFLDSEDHWDTGAPHGTAYPIEDLGALPDGVSPREFLGNVCKKTGRSIVWDAERYHPIRPENKGNWVYVDTRETIPEYPESQALMLDNKALYDYMLALDTPERARRKAEWERKS